MKLVVAASGSEGAAAFLTLMVISGFHWDEPKKGYLKIYAPEISARLTAAAEFLNEHGAPKRDSKKWLSTFTAKMDEDTLDDICSDFIDSVRTRAFIGKLTEDTTITQAQLDTLKGAIVWFNSGSTAGFKKLRLFATQVGIAPRVQPLLKVENVKQAKLLKDIQPLVKKLGGNGAKLTMDQATVIKTKKPEVYKEYLAARRQINEVYKNELMDFIRSKDGKPQSVDVVRQHMNARGIVENLIPEGFRGLIGETGNLYSADGREIDGYPHGLCVMNPKYTPSNKQFVFTVKIPSGVQYFYCKADKSERAVERFEKVTKLTEIADSVRAKWIVGMKHTDPSVRIPSMMMELSYMTAMRIGTPGNSAKLPTGVDVETLGLTTLKAGSVKTRGAALRLEFPGKGGTPHKYDIKPVDVPNKLVIKILNELVAGKSRADSLFTLDGQVFNARVVNLFFRKLTGMNVTIHKIRHMRGTKLAKEVIASGPYADVKKKVDQLTAEKWYKEAMMKVGKLLNHMRGVGTTETLTSATAIKNYIDPAVTTAFFVDRGLRVPKWAPKITKD